MRLNASSWTFEAFARCIERGLRHQSVFSAVVGPRDGRACGSCCTPSRPPQFHRRVPAVKVNEMQALQLFRRVTLFLERETPTIAIGDVAPQVDQLKQLADR